MKAKTICACAATVQTKEAVAHQADRVVKTLQWTMTRPPSGVAMLRKTRYA